MRIRKLTRHYNLSIQELKEYFDTLGLHNQSSHPNAKLNDEIIEKIFEHFELKPLEAEEEAIHTDTTLEEASSEIDSISGAEEALEADSEKDNEEKIANIEDSKVHKEEAMIKVELEERTSSEDTYDEAGKPNEDEVILSDQLLEIIEVEGSHTDLEKIKLIKAPKKELAGLKVLGKIEVFQDDHKKSKKKKESERDAASPEYKRKLEDEKENRRLKAKKKREEYQARQAKKERDKERERLKNIKKTHYTEKISQNLTPSSKTRQHKSKKQAYFTTKEADTTSQIPIKRKQPKTVFGKLWQWLNTSGYEE